LASAGAIFVVSSRMDRDEWRRSILLIALLLLLAILVAQSRRDCEVPGSSWVPCLWGKSLSQK
jgi:membrane-associated phospholipid phosphatase